MEQQRLSQKLRIASRKEHGISDSLVAARLIVTATDKRRWATALTAFWHITVATEKTLKSKASDLGGAEDGLSSILNRVARTGAYEADLQTFYGSAWREKIAQPSQAVRVYLERIRIIEAESPHLLLAHAYTQHMALLAGGRILRRSVRASLQLGPEDPGTAIFEFQDSAKQLKEAYKLFMDGVEEKLGEQKTKEVIEEHRLIFKLNNEIIREFPITPRSTVTGCIKLLPPEVVLITVSVVLALLMVFYTRHWVVSDPEAVEFADPDAVIA